MVADIGSVFGIIGFGHCICLQRAILQQNIYHGKLIICKCDQS